MLTPTLAAADEPAAQPFDARPALVATFYGPAAAIATLSSALGAAYALPAADGLRWLIALPLPTNGDSAAAQLVCNLAGDPANAWAAARRQLAAALPPALTAPLWGFSVLYQALLPPDADDARIAAFVRCARPPHAADDAPVPRLAAATLAASQLWLTAAPLAVDRPPAAVYVALGPPADEARISEWLTGPAAPWLLADLVAHKAYWQRRQLHQPLDAQQPDGPTLRDRFKDTLDALRQATGAVLNAGDDPRATEQRLEAVAREYDRVVDSVPQIDNLRVQIEIQRHNLDVWTRDWPAAQQPLFDFHRQHMTAAIRDLALLVQRGRDAQQTAATTIGLAQARIDRARSALEAEENRLAERRNLLLALLGAALAVPQFFDRDVAAALLASLRLPAPAAGYPIAALVATQIGVMLLVMLLTAAGMALVARRND